MKRILKFEAFGPRRVNETFVPRNIEGRVEMLKKKNVLLLQQEVIEGHVFIDASFANIDATMVKCRRIEGDVILKLDHIPLWLKNIVVAGDFGCSHNKLTSLKGCPKEVSGNFWCINNLLTSLEGSSQEVSGDFDCSDNQLTSLVGGPLKVSGSFWCCDNKLTSLKGCPQYVGGYFSCSNNKLPTDIQIPEGTIIKGKFIK